MKINMNVVIWYLVKLLKSIANHFRLETNNYTVKREGKKTNTILGKQNCWYTPNVVVLEAPSFWSLGWFGLGNWKPDDYLYDSHTEWWLSLTTCGNTVWRWLITIATVCGQRKRSFRKAVGPNFRVMQSEDEIGCRWNHQTHTHTHNGGLSG